MSEEEDGIGFHRSQKDRAKYESVLIDESSYEFITMAEAVGHFGWQPYHLPTWKERARDFMLEEYYKIIEEL